MQDELLRYDLNQSCGMEISERGMINFDRLEAEQSTLNDSYINSPLFPHVVIDNFCDPTALNELVSLIPSPETDNISKSRDYIFAKNKFEKSNFRGISSIFDDLYSDLISERFKGILQKIVAAPVWVDTEFHGGGLHQGGRDSFLDMHADFSHHPLHPTWERELNILLYLNKGWKPEYNGQLELKNKETGATGAIEPIFNRCVIMQTKAHTLHGYGRIKFPEGEYRRSLATYAYRPAKEGAKGRSTTWFPSEGGKLKGVIGKSWPALVAVKSKIFGSGTSRNK